MLMYDIETEMDLNLITNILLRADTLYEGIKGIFREDI